MADLDTDFAAKIAALAPTNTPVQQNYFSTDKVEPRVWYQRRGGSVELLLSGIGPAIGDTTYEVQVDGLDPDAAGAIADTLRASLNGFRGVIGSNTVLGMFVEDVGDDFVQRGLDSDDGYHVFAFNVRVIQ